MEQKEVGQDTAWAGPLSLAAGDETTTAAGKGKAWATCRAVRHAEN